MANKLMYITNNDTKNYLFCRLQLVVETLGLSLYDKTLGTKHKQPNVPSLPCKIVSKYYDKTIKVAKKGRTIEKRNILLTSIMFAICQN